MGLLVFFNGLWCLVYVVDWDFVSVVFCLEVLFCISKGVDFVLVDIYYVKVSVVFFWINVDFVVVVVKEYFVWFWGEKSIWCNFISVILN